MALFIRQKSNGNLYPYESHKHMLDNGDRYDVYDTNPPAAAEEPTAVEPAPIDQDRIVQIAEAIKLIDPENYGRPAGGRPALPKIAALAALTGFNMTVDEVMAGMELANKG